MALTMELIHENLRHPDHGEMPDFELLSEEILDQALNFPELNKLIEIEGEDKALILLISKMADTHFDGLPVEGGRKAQTLALWQADITSRCSETYRSLASFYPAESKSDLNNHDVLRILNLLRRGVGLAMRKCYGHNSSIN